MRVAESPSPSPAASSLAPAVYPALKLRVDLWTIEEWEQIPWEARPDGAVRRGPVWLCLAPFDD